MSERSIGADGNPISGQNSPISGAEIVQNVSEIDRNVLEIDRSVPGPSAGDSRLVVRCSSGYHGWVQGLAERLGLNVTQTITQGLLRLAEASGYHYSMPTRYTPKNPGRHRQHPRPGEPS